MFSCSVSMALDGFLKVMMLYQFGIFWFGSNVICLYLIFIGKYWQKVADERRRKPYSIMLADKNAPNEEVWRQVRNSI